MVNGVEDKTTISDQTTVPVSTDDNSKLTGKRMDQAQRKFFEVLINEDRKQLDDDNDNGDSVK